MRTFSEYVKEKRILEEKKNLKKEYSELFRALLNKYNVKSPAELSDEEKSKFFDEIKDYYTKGKGRKKKGDELVKKELDEECKSKSKKKSKK